MMKVLMGAVLALGLMVSPLMAQEDGVLCADEGMSFEQTVAAINDDTMAGKYVVLDGDALKLFVETLAMGFGIGMPPEDYMKAAQVVIPLAADANGYHTVLNFNKELDGCAMRSGNGSLPDFMLAVGLSALAEAGIEAPEIE